MKFPCECILFRTHRSRERRHGRSRDNRTRRCGRHLCDAGRPVWHVYFPGDGFCSTLTVLRDMRKDNFPLTQEFVAMMLGVACRTVCHRCRQAAEGRPHHVSLRPGHDRQSRSAGSGGLRMLRHHGQIAQFANV